MEMGAIWKGDKKCTPDRPKKNEDATTGGSQLELFDSDEDSVEEEQSLRKRGGGNRAAGTSEEIQRTLAQMDESGSEEDEDTLQF